MRLDYKILLEITPLTLLVHGRSHGQISTENMLITSLVEHVVKCSLWKPNILPSCNLGWLYLWWLAVATQCSCSTVRFKTATQYNMI